MFYLDCNVLLTDLSTQTSVSLAEYRAILAKCWKYVLSVFLLLLTSLTVFPSVTVLVTSQHASDPDNVWANVYFTPVTCFLAFNCGDYFGRILASLVQLPGPGARGQNLTLGLSVLRLIFIPLFMFCNAAPDIRNLPVWFQTDADYYALMLMFSVSNGYLGNLCMMLGPKTSDSHQVGLHKNINIYTISNMFSGAGKDCQLDGSGVGCWNWNRVCSLLPGC